LKSVDSINLTWNSWVIFFSGDGVHMDLCKVQTTMDWATLASVQDVQYFLGFANFYW
jgi:hypothetical protein